MRHISIDGTSGTVRPAYPRGSHEEGAITTNPATIDEYLARVPEAFRAALEELRRQIRALAPEATEGVAYGLAAFKYRGKPLAYIGAAKGHCGLYGMDASGFGADLAGYETSKGTIQFVPPTTLPAAVVEGLIRRRMAAIDEAATTKRGARKQGPKQAPG